MDRRPPLPEHLIASGPSITALFFHIAAGLAVLMAFSDYGGDVVRETVFRQRIVIALLIEIAAMLWQIDARLKAARQPAPPPRAPQ